MVAVPPSGNPRVNPCYFVSVGSGFDKNWELQCRTGTASWSPSRYADVRLADVDRDGKDDLIGFHSDGFVEYGAEYSSGGAFTLVTAPFACGSPGSCHLADVGGGRELDLVEVGVADGEVKVALAAFLDTDSDRIADERDNCPLIENEEQADANEDGIGDACSICFDGIDNDDDGLVDFEDAGCASFQDPSEQDPEIQCDDGLDNDGDGLIDHPWDSQCQGPTDDSERDPACGLGAEQALLLPLLFLLRRRRASH
jgi:hypothetical protein